MRFQSLSLVYQTRQYWLRARDILAREGVGVLFNRLQMAMRRLCGLDYLGNFDQGYDKWLVNNEITLTVSQAELLINEMSVKPVFSLIVPVYKVKAVWLEAAIESVKSQLYPHWQLCLADDASDDADLKKILDNYAASDSRIVISVNQSNIGIAETSNAALTLASGEFVGLLDHDDLLTEGALLHNALLINQHPDVDLTYSDEDKIDTQGKRFSPYFKPDYTPELILGQNYIGHFLVIRKSCLDAVDGFRSDYDGAQDYDLILRLLENNPSIKHIPQGSLSLENNTWIYLGVLWFKIPR